MIPQRSAKEVGDEFVGTYYETLQNSPNDLREFYDDICTISRPRLDGTMRVYYTLSDISENLNTLYSRGFDSAKVTSISSINTQGGRVYVAVDGYFSSTERPGNNNFTQVFLLAPKEKDYIVLLDILEFLDKPEAKDGKVVSEAYVPQEVYDGWDMERLTQERRENLVEQIRQHNLNRYRSKEEIWEKTKDGLKQPEAYQKMMVGDEVYKLSEEHNKIPEEKVPPDAGDRLELSVRGPAVNVGNSFVKMYYHVLQKLPDKLPRFYKDTSEIGRPGKDGVMSSSSLSNLDDKFNMLSFGGFDSAVVTKVDSVDSLGEGVAVAVQGYFTKNFLQTFFLAPQETGYFVFNDMFHFFNYPEAKDGKIVSVDDSKSSVPRALPDVAAICVKNLPPNATFAMLEDVFRQFGEIRRGQSVVRHYPKSSIGFVEFVEANAAEKAIEASPVMVGGKEAVVVRKLTVPSNTGELTKEELEFYEVQTKFIKMKLEEDKSKSLEKNLQEDKSKSLEKNLQEERMKLQQQQFNLLEEQREFLEKQREFLEKQREFLAEQRKSLDEERKL